MDIHDNGIDDCLEEACRCDDAAPRQAGMRSFDRLRWIGWGIRLNPFELRNGRFELVQRPLPQGWSCCNAHVRMPGRVCLMVTIDNPDSKYSTASRTA